MKKFIGLIVAAVIVQFVLTGCMGGAIVKKDSFAETRKIAIVSLVMPRVANTTRERNRTELQAFVERALARVHTDLKSVRDWTVLDPSIYKGGKAVLSMPLVTDEDLSSQFASPEERKTARADIDRELAQWKEEFIGPKGLADLPRAALTGDDTQRPSVSEISRIMRKHAAGLCDSLNVDAVAFVHVLASVSHPRPKTFIVSGNRTDGTVRVAQTLVIVDKTGQIIVDTGWPQLDEHARTRDLLPLYEGSGQDAVRQENIDLGDPKSKIAQAFSSLIDETAADMIDTLKKAAIR